MTTPTRARIAEKLIDPSCPWKLPRLKFEFSKYSYKMTAAEWKNLLARAKQGSGEAEWEVAVRYSDGSRDHSGKILVRRSARKAAEWFRRSAEHGFASAQSTLGVLLSRPGATEEDRREAIFWMKKAFRAGDSCSANNLAITYRESGDFRRAVFWFRKSLAAKDDGACLQLGIHYYWGRGVRTDYVMAVRFFRKAIKGKSITESERDDSFFYLGVTHLEGNGVRASRSAARKLLERANIDNDHPAAYRLLKEGT
jgi:TPR repeat protein